MAKPALAQFYTVDEVAKACGVVPKTVYRWIGKGELRAHKMGPRLLRIAIEDYRAFRMARLAY